MSIAAAYHFYSAFKLFNYVNTSTKATTSPPLVVYSQNTVSENGDFQPLCAKISRKRYYGK